MMPEPLDLLYAEDNAMDADLVRERLADAAPHVRLEVVDSGRVCLDRLAEHDFDLLLLDNHLLDVDGIEVLTQLAHREIQLPIVMVTGAGDEDAVIQSLRLGALDYVPKTPDWLEELPDVVLRARARYLAQRAAGRMGKRARRIAYVEHAAADVDLTIRYFAENARHLSVVPIGSAEEAVRIFTGPHDFDLLLIDLRLPGLNALDVIRAIQAHGELPPTIVVSGKGDDAMAIAALRLGAFDYVPKRWGYLQQLPHTIDHAIDRTQIERELAERRRAEAALRVSESRFRRLWESGILGIVLSTSDGRIVEANDAFVEMIGYPSSDVTAGTLYWSDLIVPEFREKGRDALRVLHETGIAPAWETASVRPDGRQVPMLVGAARLEGGGFLAYVLDQTDQYALRAQLVETQRLEAIGRLAGAVAHDINNLLTVAALQLDAYSRAPTKDHLSMIREAILGASKITRELLAFGQRQQLHVEPLDMVALVRALFGGVLGSIGEHIDVHLDLPLRVCAVRGDHSAIERVVVNLVANARDAMKRGGKLRVSLDCKSPSPEDVRDRPMVPASWVRLSVGDTGEGIDAKLLPHVFEPFVTSRSDGHGTGLGLASVYGIVKEHGGVVHIETKEGVGTRVDVYLPGDSARAVEAPQVQEPEVDEPCTILLVEDNPIVRGATSQTLQSAGHVVIEAEDAAAAERALRDSGAPIDVLLIDKMLPGGRFGTDVIEQVHREAPEIAAVLMSGVGAVVSDREVFLPKPFTRVQLTRAIAEARRKVGARHEPHGAP
ncbi:MAG: multi-sensor hybrid histidine kinase [Myxococcaceae bacterium]|nr:multi-sensor hybrid histidine kinase [Myxococcaceae bacterium]